MTALLNSLAGTATLPKLQQSCLTAIDLIKSDNCNMAILDIRNCMVTTEGDKDIQAATIGSIIMFEGFFGLKP